MDGELSDVRSRQRARLLGAVANIVAERGFTGLTAARLAHRAGVSRSTLYQLFDSKSDCFYTAAGEAQEQLAARLSEIGASDEPPRGRLIETTEVLMAFCASQPDAAQLVLLGVAGTGSEGQSLRTKWLDAMVDAIHEALFECYAAAPPLTAEIFVGGLWHVASDRLRAGRGDELPSTGRVLSAHMLHSLAECGNASSRRPS
jgi:AcrR family transcriptional regulator